MELYIFKTDIQNQEKAKALDTVFNKYPSINRWTIDTEDIDKVLRIESLDYLSENEVIRGIKEIGYNCEVLAY